MCLIFLVPRDTHISYSVTFLKCCKAYFTRLSQYGDCVQVTKVQLWQCDLTLYIRNINFLTLRKNVVDSLVSQGISYWCLDFDYILTDFMKAIQTRGINHFAHFEMAILHQVKIREYVENFHKRQVTQNTYCIQLNSLLKTYRENGS